MGRDSERATPAQHLLNLSSSTQSDNSLWLIATELFTSLHSKLHTKPSSIGSDALRHEHDKINLKVDYASLIDISHHTEPL